MNTAIHTLTRTRVLIVLGVLFLIAVVIIKRQNAIEASAVRYAVPTPVVGRGLVLGGGSVANKQFDINGSYICNSASSSAYIKNKNIYIENREATQSSYLVFSGDCVYTWKSKKSVGSKSCGLGQYVSLADTLSRTGMFDINSALSSALDPKILSSMGASSIAGTSVNPQQYIKQLINSCRATQLVNMHKFILPTGVVFKKSGQ